MHSIRIERHARTSGGGDDSAPVGIVAVHRTFHQRRIRDRPGNQFRGVVGPCAFDRDRDDFRRAFTVGGDLVGERLADFIDAAANFSAATANRRSRAAARIAAVSFVLV